MKEGSGRGHATFAWQGPRDLRSFIAMNRAAVAMQFVFGALVGPLFVAAFAKIVFGVSDFGPFSSLSWLFVYSVALGAAWALIHSVLYAKCGFGSNGG